MADEPGADPSASAPRRSRRRGADRPWRRLRSLRTFPRRAGSAAVEVSPSLAPQDEEWLRALVTDLLGRRDTMSQREEAAAVADAYLTLDDTGRRRFLALLARDFWTDPARIDAAVEALRATDEPGARRAAERDLRLALVPPATRLLHLFIGLESGVKFLVDLRADLLRVAGDHPTLTDLDEELRAHLATLFDVGLLELRRITWESPATLLEKLAMYEAVHAFDSWTDLKNRLDDVDRRCFAFFHPAMPAEPLVFVEIALTAGIATELPPLLDEHAPLLAGDQADTAVFYSISNCQPGLAGVNLGTALIKQVAEQLHTDLPNVRTFATLSPVPGFRSWLESELRSDTLLAGERELLPVTPDRALERLADEDWARDAATERALLALCARYLTTRRGGRAIDPVANFHLANGAAIERCNWLADPSASGMQRSVGVMVNYRYDLDKIADRAEAYAAAGEIAMASTVRELLRD